MAPGLSLLPKPSDDAKIGRRGKAGAERFLRVRGYIDTVRKHNLPVFQALVDAIAGRPFIPVSPA